MFAYAEANGMGRELQPTPEPTLDQANAEPNGMGRELQPTPELTLDQVNAEANGMGRELQPTPEPTLGKANAEANGMGRELQPTPEPTLDQANAEPNGMGRELQPTPELTLDQANAEANGMGRELQPIPELTLDQANAEANGMGRELQPTPELTLDQANAEANGMGRELQPTPEPTLGKANAEANGMGRKLQPTPEPNLDQANAEPNGMTGPKLTTDGPLPDSTLQGPRDKTLNRKRQKRNAAVIGAIVQAGVKVHGMVVDGVAKVGVSVFCTTIRETCACGKGACIEHMGYDKSPCCMANFQLQCCVDIPTTTVAAPVIVQVSKACDKEKEACECGWGNCLRKDGMAASTCCSADYEFACCTTAPTTEATTTLLPEQKLEKACNDAAALCQCGWARCIKADGFKASLCCKEGYKYKCCVDPEKSYTMVKKNTTELIMEQRAKDECKNANFTCFCGSEEYKNGRSLKFMCCDTNFKCECCDTDTLYKMKPGLVNEKQCTKKCDDVRGYGRCSWEEGVPGDACCLENYRQDCDTRWFAVAIHFVLCEGFNGPWGDNRCSGSTKKWPLFYVSYDWYDQYEELRSTGCGSEGNRFDCFDWFWYLQPTARSTTTLKPAEHMQVKTECQGAIANCACGWGACVWQPGFSASGCCKEDYSFECCTKMLPPPGGFGITTATEPSQSTPNSGIGAVPPSQPIVLAALTALTALISGGLALLFL
uniref:Uncharacterized protein n=1 Tax=Globodera rostochiensis TaxID=31243 RepID=A0A914H831_GLORO